MLVDDEFFGIRKLKSLVYGVVSVILRLAFWYNAVLPTCDGRTDGRTHDDSITLRCVGIASPGENSVRTDSGCECPPNCTCWTRLGHRC